MPSSLTVRCVALCLLSAGVPVAAAAEPGPPVAPADALHIATLPLEIVMVTASHGGSLLRDTPAAISRRDHDAIEAHKPTFIGEVLNTVPGVYMTDLGNEQHSMSIRQPLSYSAVYLYLQDGIPIRPLGLFNHNALYEINLAGVGAIEVIRGPAASLYGSNSVGGTINFLTAAPAGPGGQLGLHRSDQGLRRLDARLSGRTSGDAPDLGVQLAGYSSRRDGGWQDYNSAEKDALTGRLDWCLDARTELVTVLSYNRLRTDMPGSLYAHDYQQRPEFSYHRFTYREVEATRFSSTLTGDWLAAGPSTLTLYARDNTTEQLPSYLVFDSARDATAATGRWNDSRFTSLGLDLRQQFDADWLDARLVVGATGEFTRSDFREHQLAITRDPSSGRYLDYRVDSNRRDYHTDLDNRAVYAQLELSPLPDTRLVLGARRDQIEYDYRNRKQPGPVSGAPSERRRFEESSARLGLSWAPRTNHTLFASWAEGFTPPEVSALYGRLDVPDLAASRFSNIELGWRAELDRLPLTFDLTLYQLRGRDEVVNYSVAPGQSEPRNAGRTRHRGVEFGLEWTPSPHWQVAAAGAYSEHRFDDYRVSTTLDYSGRRMPAAPAWLGTVELRWHPAALGGLTLSLEGVYLDHYWMNNANSVRYDGHALLNLRASYLAGPWRFWLKAQNLTDRHYAEVAASSYSGAGDYLPARQDTFTPGAPRTLTLGLEYRWGSSQ